MASRRRIFLLASALAAAMATAAACGFPDPILVDFDDEGGAPEAGDDHVVAEAAPGEGGADGRSDAIDSIDANAVDANGEKPPVEAGCDPCDCDGDGFATDDASVCPDAGAEPRGDCDDEDLRANPDAGFITDQPVAPTYGDWNCDGVTNLEHSNVNVVCSDHGGLINDCNSTQGFIGNPSCNAQDTFVTCKASGITCTSGSSKLLTQGCK